MRILMSPKAVERQLRRRGWWLRALALQAMKSNWFVQRCNDFLLCRRGQLSITLVAGSDDPISIHLFKGVLAGLVDLTDEFMALRPRRRKSR